MDLDSAGRYGRRASPERVIRDRRSAPFERRRDAMNRSKINRRHLTRMTLVAAGLSVVALAFASPSFRSADAQPTPPKASPPPGPITAAPLSDDPKYTLPERLDTELRRRAPQVYAGLTRGNDGVIEVLATRDDAALQTVVREVIDSVRRTQPAGRVLPAVRVVSNKNTSLVELERIRDQILSQREVLKARGIDITELAVDPRTGKVRVGVLSLTSDTKTLLEQRFGPGIVDVFQKGRLPKLSRSADVPQFYGGILIDSSEGSCSSGFDMLKNGSAHISSAEHCKHNTWSHNGSLIGVNVLVEYRNDGPTDAQIIRADANSGRVWSTETASRGVATLDPSEEPPPFGVCSDGARSN